MLDRRSAPVNFHTSFFHFRSGLIRNLPISPGAFAFLDSSSDRFETIRIYASAVPKAFHQYKFCRNRVAAAEEEKEEEAAAHAKAPI